MYEEKLKDEKTKTKFIDEFSEEIYNQTYRFENETIDQTFDRVATDLASVEQDPTYWADKFKWVLEDFKFVPGGRIISNAGTGLKSTSYFNCFTDGFKGKKQDSMEGILRALRDQAMILKSEGGYGFCADVMRPRGGYITGIANESPGAVRMLDMWDTQSSVITSGSGKKSNKGKIKIRKGAQLASLSVWHPDICEFITAKQTPGRLTKFNMSVLVSDDFMNAVKNNLPWNLEFPDYEDNIEIYDDEWDGNIQVWKFKGYPVKVYKTYNNANELWDLILESTYNRNEPGILFHDTINKRNNLYYCEYISATNPCGEIPMPVANACLLGSYNLTQFINQENNDWDYEKLGQIIPIAVRFLDNVNDRTVLPLPEQYIEVKNKRRLGMGIMGYGSALMMMKIKYGSKQAIEKTDSLMKFISNKAYIASSLLAKEKGAFPKLDKEKYLASKFISTLEDETKRHILEYGMRNSHLLSIQPTGNTGVLANNISGGLEPVYMPTYIRTTSFPYAPNNLDLPKNIDWDGRKYDSTTNWEWIKEGDESLLRTSFDGYTWKFDKSRGLLRETVVKDYAVRYLEERGEWNPNAEWAKTSTELSIDEHIDAMAVLTKYLDNAASKTINIPSNYTYKDFKNVYMRLYDTGTIKGGTTYRAGTMTEVLGSGSSVKLDEGKIKKNNATKRPKSLPCDIYHMNVKGEEWIVMVGLIKNEPYEIFAFKPKNIKLSKSVKHGNIVKVKSHDKKTQYNLECEGFSIEDISSNFESGSQEALTRQISLSLRHGIEMKWIYEQLDKSIGDIVDFSKAIGRALKKYAFKEGEDVQMKCPECGKKTLIIESGCTRCTSCSYAGCG